MHALTRNKYLKKKKKNLRTYPKLQFSQQPFVVMRFGQINLIEIINYVNETAQSMLYDCNQSIWHTHFVYDSKQ